MWWRVIPWKRHSEQHRIRDMGSLFNFLMIEQVIMPSDLAFPLPNSDYISCGYIGQSKIKVHHQT